MEAQAHLVRIDGRTIQSRADFYAAIDKVADTPDWFGHNLDALFDVLVAIWPKPTMFEWAYAPASAATMGPDFDIVVGVLRDAEVEPRSQFTLRVFDAAVPIVQE